MKTNVVRLVSDCYNEGCNNYMNEKVEMTKKQFIGWIFGSLMLATLTRLITKAFIEFDVDGAIIYVIDVIKYGGLVGSAISMGCALNGLRLALQSETESEMKRHVRTFVKGLFLVIMLLLVYIVYGFVGTPTTGLVPSF